MSCLRPAPAALLCLASACGLGSVLVMGDGDQGPQGVSVLVTDMPTQSSVEAHVPAQGADWPPRYRGQFAERQEFV